MVSVRSLVTTIAACIVATPIVAYGQTISAAWNPNSAEDLVTNYEVCIGTTSLSCNFQRATVPATENSYPFTPAAGVVYYVAVRAVSAVGPGPYSPEIQVSIPGLTQPANQTSTVNVPVSPLVITASDPDGGTLRFSHTGLPFGLSLNSTTGVISGTPTTTGTFVVTVFVTDGIATTTRSFGWTVQPPGTADTTAPTLTITSHSPGQTVTTSSITLAGTATDSGAGGSGITGVTVNSVATTGGTASGSNATNWSRSVNLSVGDNMLTVVATDGAGNVRSSQITVNRTGADLTAPTLAITSHINGQTVTTSSITLAGTATDSGAGGSGVMSVTVNGAAATGGTATGSNTANWSRAVSLTTGANSITVVARDGANNTRTSQITITRAAGTAISSLTGSVPAPQVAGTSITFTATANGGTAPYEFKWFVWTGTGWTTARDWGAATYTWTPMVANANYRIGVWVRTAGSTDESGSVNFSIPYAISPLPALTLTGITGNVASPQAAGTTITFTATASGGTAPHQFKWFIWNGTTWTTVQDWGNATYAWTPTLANSNYRVGVWARSAGSGDEAGSVNLSISYPITVGGPSALRLTGIAGNAASPQAVGTTVTLTASASGGSAPYQFKWFIWNGATWTTVQDWGGATYTWTPTVANWNYRVGVWARSAGSSDETGSVNLSIPYPITSGAPTLRLTGITANASSPQRARTTITFTATATGGTAPYQFKWFIWNGTTWTTVQNWSSSATYSWTPSASNAYYRVGVWARSAGSRDETGSVNLSIPFVVVP